jgi:hypothetical protein
MTLLQRLIFFIPAAKRAEAEAKTRARNFIC